MDFVGRKMNTCDAVLLVVDSLKLLLVGFHVIRVAAEVGVINNEGIETLMLTMMKDIYVRIILYIYICIPMFRIH